MKTIETEIVIDAPRADVWRELTDFDAMPSWNPFIRSISGELRPGARLEVRLDNGRGGGMTFRPTVQAATPNEELRWLGRLLMPGIFDGEHRFQLVDEPGARTRLLHSERFSGLLVPLMGNVLQQTRDGFVRMNEALKQRVETRAVAKGASGGAR